MSDVTVMFGGDVLFNGGVGRTDLPGGDHEVLLASIAKARVCLTKGGELDDSKAADLLLDDFRNGRLGRISLERPGASMIGGGR